MGLNVSKAAASAVLALGLVGGADAATLPIFGADDFVEDVPVTGLTDVPSLDLFSINDFSDTFTVAPGVDAVRVSYEPISSVGAGGVGLTELTITVNGASMSVGDGVSFLSNGFFLFNVVQGADANTITISGTPGPNNGFSSLDIAAVPIPAAGLLFGGALLGAGLLRRSRIREEVGLPQAS